MTDDSAPDAPHTLSAGETLGTRIRRGLAWSALNNILLRVGNLGLSIVLARLLMPAEFGVYAVGLTVHAVLVALADLGVSADLIRNGDVRRRGPTVATMGLGAGVVTAVAMAVTAGPVAAQMGSPQAASVVQVMSLALLLSGLGVVPYAVLQREFMQGRQMICDVLGFLTLAGVTLSLVLMDVGPLSLAIGRVVSQAVVTLAQFSLARIVPRFGWDRGIARSAFVFGGPIAATNLLSWLVINVDNMLVGNALGAVSLGLYVMAFNLSSWPMNAVGTAIRSVALPGFSRVIGDARASSDALARAAGLTLMIAVPLSLLLTIFGQAVVVVLFGSPWISAAAPLYGLAAFGALRILFDVLAAFLYARGASGTVFFIQSAWLALIVPAMLLGIHGWGLVGAGWAHLVVGLVLVLPLYLFAVHRGGVRLGAMVPHAAPVLLACAPAAIVGLWLNQSLELPLARMLVGGAITGLVYLLGLWLLAWVLPRWRGRSAPHTDDPESAGVHLAPAEPDGLGS